MSIILTVRPSLQIELRYGRVHRPSMELALSALKTRVLLYAPRDEAQHGYFGSASVIDLNWDAHDQRFLILTLGNVEIFAAPVSISTIQTFRGEAEDLAHEQPHHYSQGIRSINADLFERIMRSASDTKPGVSDWAQPPMQFETVEDRERRQREELIRSHRLRLNVLLAYKFTCAVTGLRIAPLAGNRHECEVCHIMPVKRDGPDVIQNAFPAIRSAHWAFDNGLFTVRPNRKILFSPDAPADLKWLFRGKTHARFPDDPALRPKTEYLEFHFNDVFNK